MLRITILILFVSIAIFPASAQHLNNIKFSKEDIQLYDGVTGMYEDENGYIWVYGRDGISRFDGFVFEQLRDIYPEAKKLPVKGCLTLSKDENFLWIGTGREGIFVIGNNGKLQHFDELIRTENDSSQTWVRQLIAANGKLFTVGKNGFEAYKVNGDKYEKIELEKLDTKSVSKIYLHQESLWIENNSGLQQLNVKTLDLTAFDPLKNISFFVHPDGDLWIASIADGTILYRFDRTSSTFGKATYQPYRNYKKMRGYAWLSNTELLSTPLLDVFLEIASFDDDSIERIDKELSDLGKETKIKNPFSDSNGRTWFFGKDLYMIPPKGIVDQHFISKNLGSVNDMLISDEFSYVNIKDKGLYKYNIDGVLIQNYTKSNSKLADNNIISIEPMGNDSVGLVMWNHFQILEKKGVLGQPFHFEGRISTSLDFYDYTQQWVGTPSNFLKVNVDKGTTEQVYVNNQHQIVQGHSSVQKKYSRSYLHLISAEGSSLPNHYKGTGSDLYANLASKLFLAGKSSRIQDVRISPSGNTTISATDDGLYLIKDSSNLISKESDPQMKMLASMIGPDPVRIKTADDYFTNAVFYNDSIVYATSRNKIYRIALNSMKIETFGKLQGTINNEYTARSSYKDKEGKIYFGGDIGIDVLDEKSYNESSSLSSLEIDQIYHNGLPQLIFPDQKHHIPSHIKIAEIKVNMPKNLIGDFMRIQGNIDKSEWTDLSGDHTMSLFNPAPGVHNIAFRGIDKNDIVRTQVHEVQLQVQRIWYKQAWLWVVLGILIVSAIFTAKSRREKKRSQKVIYDAHLQEEMASLKLTSLNSQMNPHFIFNALSSIQQLITSGDTKVAEDYLSKFSKLLRHVIQYASYKNVKLTEELKFIENYLDLELLRFENAFEYRIENLVEQPDQVDIPPFFIQPQVENAIKHGFVKHKKSNLLNIKLEEIEDRIIITIEDNGQGRAQSMARSIYSATGTKKGNLLTEERIKNLNKLNYESTYEVKDIEKDGAPCGTKVILGFKNNKSLAK